MGRVASPKKRVTFSLAANEWRPFGIVLNSKRGLKILTAERQLVFSRATALKQNCHLEAYFSSEYHN
jgi:hypothetical protein